MAQSIPSYAMSCFDLTKSLCDEMGKMICTYWWAQQDKENKMHWVSWEEMCRRKEKGGLGYRDLHLFNLAMLARQGWRIFQNPDSLCAQLLMAKYGTNDSLLQVKEGLGTSYTWRSIVRELQALKKEQICRIGDGVQIKIWEDPWIPNRTTRRPITPRGHTVLTCCTLAQDGGMKNWCARFSGRRMYSIYWQHRPIQIMLMK